MKASAPYRGLGEILARYWKIYGGWRALFTSVYFHLSIVLLAASFPLWIKEGWWEQVLSITPNLLGFTLGGFAIFLSFGDERFKATISGAGPEDGDSPSPYLLVCATYLHFVLMQFLALLVALTAKAAYAWTPLITPLPSCIATFVEPTRIAGWAFGYWIFLYSLMLIGAAAMATFRLASWYDSYQTSQKANEDL